MTGKLNLVYVTISCYNGRARMDFGFDRRDGSVKVRRVRGPSTRFSNIVGDINDRRLRSGGCFVVHTQGWTFFPSRPRRRG